MENLKEDNKCLNEHIVELKEENENILSSNSWKVTKPLRVLMNILR